MKKVAKTMSGLLVGLILLVIIIGLAVSHDREQARLQKLVQKQARQTSDDLVEKYHDSLKDGVRWVIDVTADIKSKSYFSANGNYELAVEADELQKKARGLRKELRAAGKTVPAGLVKRINALVAESAEFVKKCNKRMRIEEQEDREYIDIHKHKKIQAQAGIPAGWFRPSFFILLILCMF